jgi:hypothetical protein
VPASPSIIPFSFYYRGAIKPQTLADSKNSQGLSGYRRVWWLLLHEHDSRHFLAKAGALEATQEQWLDDHARSLDHEAQFAGLTLRLYNLEK